MSDEPRTSTRRDPVEEAVRQWSARHPDASAFRGLTALIRTYGVVVRGVETILRPLGLNLSRFEVLLLLQFTREGRLPMTRLRDLLMIHGSSVTYLVDRLEEAGLVARRPDPADGRVSLVCITDEGHLVADRAAALLVEHDFGPIAALPEERRELLADLLGALRGDEPA